MRLFSSLISIFIIVMSFQTTYSQTNNSIIVVYNNMESENNLRCDWGYSAWIEFDDEIVLFDSGTKPEILQQNLNKLNLNPVKISTVAISHNHYDHIGGLESVLSKVKKNTNVYLPVDSDLNLKENFPDINIIVNTKYQKITENVWLTKVFQNNVQEQAMVIENDNKIIVITGCAHPGIVEMCASVKSNFPNKKLELVTGGFHLRQSSNNEVVKISDQLKKLGVEKIAPSHCTGDNSIAVFKERWQENFLQLNLGDSYRF